MARARRNIFALLFTLVLCVPGRTGHEINYPEMEDVNIIYILQGENTNSFANAFNGTGDNKVVMEYHARTNSLGKLIELRNGSILDQYVGTPDFGCPRTVSQCSWQQDGWSTGRVKTNVLSQLIYYWTGLGVTDAVCFFNNGGCMDTCREENGVAVCSCPPGFSLQSDQRSCRPQQSCGAYLNEFSESFNSPNYPNNYQNNINCTWVIAVPKHDTIELNFLAFKTEPTHDFVSVYDGDSTSNALLGQYHGFSIPGKVTSRGNRMLVIFRTDGSNTYSGFRANYNTVQVSTYSTIYLSEDQGSLTSPPVLLSSNALCVSIMYKLASQSSRITVSSVLSNGTQLDIPLLRDQIKEDEWQIGRFRMQLPPGYNRQPLTLSVSVTGKNSSVFSIMGCNANDDEDIIVLSGTMSESNIPDVSNSPNEGPQNGCYHGGIWFSNTAKCLCPTGFIGDTCEEVCGPNSYGHDCGGKCSGFRQGCQGMVFCQMGRSCMCAPGFKDQYCLRECSNGEYGAGCLNNCGHCRSGFCDPYTGICPDGCSPGYYPPFCQETYKYVTPTVEYIHYNSAMIGTNTTQASGRGSVRFYQLQYKELTSSSWRELQPKLASSEMVLGNVTGLNAGVMYQVQMILMDNDGNSYQGQNVPTVTFETACKVPDASEYHIKYTNIASTSFGITWEYKSLNIVWCTITGFEVVLAHRWRTLLNQQPTTSTTVSYENLIPGETYEVKLRAVTKYGNAPFSDILRVTTNDNAPGEVVNLTVVKGEPEQLRVSWNKPWFTGGTIRQYRIQFQCLRLLSCPDSCTYSAGQLDVSSTSALLSGLLPHAQYSVKVCGMSADLGPYRLVEAATDHTAPSISVEASPMPVTQVTNSSFVVHWKPPSNCSKLNGFSDGYRYQLVSDIQHAQEPVQSGTTSNTNASFTGLTPLTKYQVLVYIVTSGGWSANHRLVIDATTGATTPEGVQNLTVYKKGRRMLGIRWAPPLHSYANLKSFTVSHRKVEEGKDAEIHEIIPAIQCKAWPDLYCHTINKLEPEKTYMVSVQARNIAVDTDGKAIQVITRTREVAPGAPTDLRIYNRTQNGLVLEWKLPSMINGVLRSFLVNVEETDSVNASTCCEYFPIQELPVRSEDQTYRLEVNGLHAASTFTISVSAKTVTLGPSVNVTANTPPEPPKLVHALEVVRPSASSGDLFSVSINNPEDFPGLKSTYLLLVLPPGDAPETTIWDQDLTKQLRTAVGQSFYLVGEYQPVEIANGQWLHFGTDTPPANGTLGGLTDPALTPGETYSVGVALVLDYNGAKSVGFLASESFVAQ